MKRVELPRSDRSVGRLALFLVILALCLMPSIARSQELDRCATVELRAPVILPDGSSHRVPSLTICLRSKPTPVTGLHEIRLDRMPTGMALSRMGKSEGYASQNPVVVFQRTEAGEMRLIGYALPDGKHMRTYALRGFGKARNTLRADAETLLDVEQPHVFVAAVGGGR